MSANPNKVAPIGATWPRVRRAWREAMVMLHSARRLGDVSGAINRKAMLAGDGLRQAVEAFLGVDGLEAGERLILRRCQNGLPALLARLINDQGDPLAFELFGDVEAIAEDVLARCLDAVDQLILETLRKHDGRMLARELWNSLQRHGIARRTGQQHAKSLALNGVLLPGGRGRATFYALA